MISRRPCILLLLLLTLMTSSCYYKTITIKTDDTTAFRSTLEKHPEVILEILRQNKIELMEIVSEGRLAWIRESRKQDYARQYESPRNPKIDENRPFLGSATAPIDVIIYFSFGCGYCGEIPQLIDKLLEVYPTTFRFFFKHVVADRYSIVAAEYFEAVSILAPDKVWEYQKEQFSLQGRPDLSEDVLYEQLSGLGIEKSEIEDVIESANVSQTIEADLSEALELGVPGTPAFLVGGILISGLATLEEFEDVLEVMSSKQGQ